MPSTVQKVTVNVIKIAFISAWYTTFPS